MEELSRQRCFHHRFREAAARCPECTRFFCRECITEHENRVLCNTCLQKTVYSLADRKSWTAPLFQIGFFTLGILILWFSFFYLGQLLIWAPDAFHEGSLWTGKW